LTYFAFYFTVIYTTAMPQLKITGTVTAFAWRWWENPEKPYIRKAGKVAGI